MIYNKISCNVFSENILTYNLLYYNIKKSWLTKREMSDTLWFIWIQSFTAKQKFQRDRLNLIESSRGSWKVILPNKARNWKKMSRWFSDYKQKTASWATYNRVTKNLKALYAWVDFKTDKIFIPISLKPTPMKSQIMSNSDLGSKTRWRIKIDEIVL